jgi:CheY-like chemotaxis protein
MAQKTVLIVEDEASSIAALQEKLHHEEYSTLEAKNGEEALKIAIKQQPDLILLDLLMPRMNGEAFLKELRQDKWGERVPVMVLTNLAGDSPMVEAVIKYKPIFYLQKTDWTLEELMEKIKDTLM